MRFFNLFFEFIIFHLILIVTSASNSTSIDFSHKTSPRTRASTMHLPHTQPTRASSRLFLPPLPTSASRTVPVVVPSRLPHLPPNSPSRQHPQSGQKPILIIFEVLGGLVASGLLLGLLRCCYRYKKAPKRDRIAEVLNRHHLQRELEEIERNPHILRPSLREPAPPYFPAPPSYDIISSTPTIAYVPRTNYTDVDTRPSSSPLVSPQSLEFPSQPDSRRSPDLIPPRPAVVNDG